MEDVILSIYAALGPALLGLLGWGAKKLVGVIEKKVDNEIVEGMLRRLTGSVMDAVTMVDQTLRSEIEKAKSPDSPGGEKITAAEARKMRAAVWQALKSEYGGWDGLFSLLRRIGLGDKDAASRKVDTMIEAAVSTHKMRKKIASPQ